MKEEELLRKLRSAFKCEAEERIGSMSSSLIELEKASAPEERKPILDAIFREAHSLKGAARAVNLTEIETLCQAVEAETKSILVVEDSITSRMLLKNILEAAGYFVKTAVDGQDAYATLKTEDLDLVVSDVEMPRMDGFELTAKIRSDKRLEETPVVLVTALESREDRERGIDAGADAYIVKSSFDQSNLLEVIGRLI